MERLSFFVFALLFVLGCASSVLSAVANLTAGASSEGVLGITLRDWAKNNDFYRVWVPASAWRVEVTLTNRAPDTCDYLGISVRPDALPCSHSSEDGQPDNSFCLSNTESDNGDADEDPSIKTFTISSSDVEFIVDSYWYFGVWRYSADDFDKLCAYSIKVTVDACPEGQLYSAQGDGACVGAWALKDGEASTYKGNTSNALFWLPIPAGAGSVEVWLNSTDSDLTVYGRSRSPVGDNDYKCSDSSPSTDDSNINTYHLTCYTPKEGIFFISVEDAEGDYDGTIWSKVTVCPSGKGGFDCHSDVFQYDPLGAITPVYALNNTGADEDPYAYAWVELLPWNKIPAFVVSASFADGSSGYLYRRFDGFPWDSSQGYDNSIEWTSFSDGKAELELVANDLYNGDTKAKRLYFAIQLTSSGAHNVSFSAVAVLPPPPPPTASSGDVSTTGSVTGDLTTVGTSGATTGATSGTSGSVTPQPPVSPILPPPPPPAPPGTTGTTKTGSASSLVLSFFAIALVGVLFL